MKVPRSLALIVPVALLTACGSATSSTSTATAPSPVSGASQSPVATTTPAASATPVAQPPPGFVCADSMGHVDGPAPVQARITSVDAATHADMGYDRFVIRFDSSPGSITVTLQENASFTTDGQGSPVTLEGSAGAKVVVGGVDVASYTGSRDLRPEGTILREARQIGAFEGQVTWALGLSRPACIRVVEPFIGHLLVVDVAAR